MIIGCDPGIRGAIAFFAPDGSVKVEDMPTRTKSTSGKIKNEIDPLRLRAILRHHTPADEKGLVVMENLNTFAGGSVQTMGSLEATKAVITTVCELSGFDVAFVSPKTWQGFYGIKRTPSEDTKSQSLRIARQLFGNEFCPLQKHDGRADALLIARYGQRHFV